MNSWPNVSHENPSPPNQTIIHAHEWLQALYTVKTENQKNKQKMERNCTVHPLPLDRKLTYVIITTQSSTRKKMKERERNTGRVKAWDMVRGADRRGRQPARSGWMEVLQ